MSTKPQQLTTKDTTRKNFKRLLGYAKIYKAAAVVSILGMLGYAAIDSFVFSQLQPLIDKGLDGQDPEFMKWAPFVIVIMFILRGICHFAGNYTLAWLGNNVVANIPVSYTHLTLPTTPYV